MKGGGGREGRGYEGKAGRGEEGIQEGGREAVRRREETKEGEERLVL